MKEEWFQSLKKTLESPYAPKWNTLIGDRITKNDFYKVKQFEINLYEHRDFMSNEPRDSILNFVRSLRFFSTFFYDRLLNLSIEKDFQLIPFMTREDLQQKLSLILPHNQSLDRLIVNPTSGTTGTPILAPNHPYAIGCYVPLVEYSLQRHNVKMIHHFENTSAIQLCHQNETIVYASCHSLAGGAKFAKINLKQNDWHNEEDKLHFIEEQSPTILTGDPYSFEEAIKTKLNYRPKAIHSTALELEDSLRLALTKYFQCPVINFYSLNETGPIAYSCPVNAEWFHILPHDIYMEIIDKEGNRCSEGEIVITGGRNPYLPLLRYRTGDFGELNFTHCNCGEKSPRLKLLKGRKPVSFTDTSGHRINPVDISRILRMEANILRHQFIQKKGYDYEINLSCLTSPNQHELSRIKSKFLNLLGKDAEIRISLNLPNDQKKIMIFINENLTE